MKYKYCRAPFLHQHLSVKHGLRHRQWGCWNSPGTGKSKVAIDLMRFRNQLEKVKRILIVCPLCVLENWRDEIQWNSMYKAVILRGSQQDRLKALEQDEKFFVVNYEGIIIPRIHRALIDKGFGAVVFDESIKLKGWRSKRSRAAFGLARAAELIGPGIVVLLSGCPYTNDVSDLFGQFLVMDGGKTYGRNYFKFRNRYFRRVHTPFPKFVLRPGALAEIRQRMRQRSIAFKKKDCLDLPAKVYKTYTTDLHSDQKKHYDAIEGNPLVRAMKQQQITGGFLYGEGDNTLLFSPNPKLELLEDSLREEYFGNRVVIVCRFHADLDLVSGLCNRILPGSCVELSGRTNIEHMKRRFQTEQDKIRYAALQIDSGSLALNLFTADNMIFYSLNYKLDDYEQVQDRVHRQGFEGDKCEYTHLIVRNTVDEHIATAIKKKKNISDYLMEIYDE